MVILALTTLSWCGIGLLALVVLGFLIVGGSEVAQENEAYRKRLSRMTLEEIEEERRRIDTWGFD